MNKRTFTSVVVMMVLGVGACLISSQFHRDQRNHDLCLAASQGDTRAVERLLKQGANPNAVGSIGDTECNCEENPSPAPAIVLAIYQTSGDHQEHFDTVAALLKAGADVNAKGNAGLTALMWASSPRMVKYLVAHGADVNLKNDFGETALTQSGVNPEIKRLLIQAGAH
ncbi:MAG: ankyrin repeat domain-containing protein [Capsulimonas sp.]|uniref:ankyrin repeat domain-containing protein n=1 Tax=Capsulimonas sp. TaxID=2494211 RepID=UPI00326576AD